MNEPDAAFFDAYDRFLTAHEACPDGPEHMQIHVGLPPGQPECSVAFTGICARIVLDCARRVGESILAGDRKAGIPSVKATKSTSFTSPHIRGEP
jgi:hypothetical protein